MAEGILGRDLWAEPLWGGERTLSAWPAVFRTVEYQLELRNSTNGLVSILRNFDNPEWTEEVNRPDSLTFTYPAEDDDAQYLDQPYQIWLRDSVTGTLLQRFKIIRSTLNGVFPDTIDVFCQDFLIQLTQEWITTYQKTVTDAYTFRQILQGYLDWQVNSNKVAIGSMSGGLATRQTNTWATNKSVLNAIETIHETVGGYYHCNAHRRLDWKTRLYPNAGQQFRRRKNMLGITHIKRHEEIVNRLYAYGHGSARATRLNLIDAGEANEYIDDAASIAALGGAAGGGIRCGYWQDGSIENAAELLAKTQTILDDKSSVRVDYTIDVIDLSQSALKELAYERIYLGSPRRIIDEVLGISTLQNVVKIVRSLKNPLQVQVVLANIPRNLSSLWKKTVRDQQEFQNEDAESPLLDDAGFETAIETALGITDVAEIGTWNTGTDTGTLNDLMEDIYELMVADDPATSDLRDDWEDLLDDTLEDALETLTGATDASTDIAHWNDAADTGNLDTHIADMLTHDPTTILTTNAPEDCTTGAAAVGTGTRGARDDHVHHYVDTGSSLFAGTPAADTAAGTAGVRTDVTKGDHSHIRSTLYSRMYRQTTAPGGTLYGGDEWEDTNDGSGPAGENQMYKYNAGSTAWVPYLLLT